MKLTGTVLLVVSTTLLGVRMGMDMDIHYGQLRELQRLLYLLKSEITYSRAYLAEAFFRISEEVKQPYSMWLKQLSSQMKKRDGQGFEIMWKETIDTYLCDLKIGKQEKVRLLELGTYLCGSDVTVQIKSIELCEEQLCYTMEEMREGMRTKKKLCHCLGIMGGVFLAILLL